MTFRNLILVATIAFSLSLPAETKPSKVPHQLAAFYESLERRFKDLEEGLTMNQKENSISDRFLKSVFLHFNKNRELEGKKDLSELSLSPELKSKLISLIENTSDSKTKLNKNEITFDDISKILSDKSEHLTDKEKRTLAAILLVHLQKKLAHEANDNNAIESLILEFQKDPILKPLASTEKPMTKGLDLLADMIGKGLGNPESLSQFFNPLKEQIFISEKEKLPELSKVLVPSFSETLSNLRSLQPVQPDFSPIGNGLALNPFQGGGKQGSCNSQGRFGVPRQGTGFSGERGRTPETNDTPELKACVQAVRQKRFNVELQLPGALCASTAIAKDPQKTLLSFNNSRGQCQVNLATALHCIEGQGSLIGRSIRANIDGPISAQVTHVGTSDRIIGQSVENGNSDLVVLTVEVPCTRAKSLHLARVPSPEEVFELQRIESLPLVLQQNATINASQQGDNQATIAATGSFQTTQAGLGNFIRFNSNSKFNSSSGKDRGPLSGSSGLVLNSDRIKSGDSGGAALSCNFDDDKKVKEILYLGAISHITVRGDSDEGKEGGIASGQSLLNLSRSFWGNEKNGVQRLSSNSTNNSLSH